MHYGEKKLRHELKFYISCQDYAVLSRRMQAALQRDEFDAGGTGYHVRSLYFDDIYDSALFEKNAGVFRRKKYRIRIYNKQSDVIKFERKSKFGQYICKESCRISREEADRLLCSDIDFLPASPDRLLQEFYIDSRTRLFKPKVIVDYVREAFVCGTGDVRVTFDRQLQTGVNTYDIFSRDVVTVNSFDQPVVVLEVKFNEFLPEHIRMLLGVSGRNSTAISKYVICRENLQTK